MVIRDFEALAQQWCDLEAAGIPLAPLEDRVGIDGRNSGRVLTITLRLLHAHRLQQTSHLRLAAIHRGNRLPHLALLRNKLLRLHRLPRNARPFSSITRCNAFGHTTAHPGGDRKIDTGLNAP